MKCFLNRRPVEGPWGGGNLLIRAMETQLQKLGHQVVYQLCDNIDVIFMQDPRPGNTGISINEIVLYKQMHKDVKIIHRVNECDARKGTSHMDSLLQECSKFTDKTIFVSNWMRNYHLTKGWQCNDTCVIYNGVNLDHFKKRDKIDNGKINLVTHHWSNNEMKGFDIYEGIDYFVGKNDKYTFTYIGRENGTFKNTDVIQPLFGRELGKMLSSYDVYISGSRWDPGPNHVLESLACEIPTYVHTDGGGAVEFAGKENSYDSIESLISIIESNRFTENKMSPVSWIECINLYEKSILL